ncbi:MAG: neutral/alkaline non-lysosomal ceramidase N-terminal domain-containing protein [Actinomycetota bacterium]
MRRLFTAVLMLVVSLPGLSASEPAPVSKVRAGYGEADASWRVGSGSGQYAEKDPNLGHLLQGDEADPFNHAWTQRPSYGVQSRLSYRTVVVEGSNGERVAFVKSDHYLASDALTRRAAQILDAAGTSGIAYEDIMLMASHNHSSPFYYSPSAGVWLFQDAFDVRAFEYAARRMAESIERAAASLRPARMGATVVEHKIYKGNIAGATIGDDGAPAGYPDTHADFGMTVIRFDEVPSGAPIALLVNHGQHPESLDDYDLITADYLAPMERMVERDLGANVVWSQGDVGSAEGPYFRDGYETLPDGVIRAWAHVGHAQTERGARYLADAIVEAYTAIGSGDAIVPFTTDFPVAAGNAWVPGPVSHPHPSVSNCRTEPTIEGRPGLPILGLPDCERGTIPELYQQTELWQQLKATGVPVPEHYDAPSFGSVQEHTAIHIQAFRMGEVVLASCACEAQMDLILNFESRANDVAGDIFDGYEYPCTQNPDSSWNCQTGSKLQNVTTISDAQHARMVAQVHNDAAGWEDPANALAANAESPDPAQIKGNFTKEELPSEFGYKLPVGVGHAGDYNGYVVSYREYQSRDHYRKALTAYGAHTADYMTTRMARLAGSLKGGPALEPEPLEAVATADLAREEAFMLTLGQVTSAAYDLWLAALPDDLGPAEAIAQPANITHFDGAEFTWRGGSNAVDNPIVSVERQIDGVWKPFADQSGEVQTRVQFPSGIPGLVETWTGGQEWQWTANFEAFVAFPARLQPNGETPPGTYRFVVDGVIHQGGADEPYHLESDPFTVSPWTGLTATATKMAGGSIAVTAATTYPRTYESSFRFIADDGNAVLCKTCSFRPWAKTAAVTAVLVKVLRSTGVSVLVPATLRDGVWVADTALDEGDIAMIAPGGIVDAAGATNATTITLRS